MKKSRCQGLLKRRSSPLRFRSSAIIEESQASLRPQPKRLAPRKIKLAKAGANKSKDLTRNRKKPEAARSLHSKSKSGVKTLSLSLVSGAMGHGRRASGLPKGRIIKKQPSGDLNQSNEKGLPFSSSAVFNQPPKSR